MRPRIAIPMPHSTDREYSERAIPQYEHAISVAEGEPVHIPLDLSAADIKKLMQSCNAVLLPGSKADVDPAKFQQPRSPHSAAADARREENDFLLLEDAYAHRKPVLGICYGLQSLNVFRGGSLIQHIPEFLPESARAKVDHAAGKNVTIAHTVEIAGDSKIGKVIRDNRDRGGRGFTGAEEPSQKNGAFAPKGDGCVVPVNSSHHQSADAIGEGLRVVARCPDDSIIEALEGVSPNHLVLAVQWHPERSVDDDETSKAIFRKLVESAR